MDATSESLKQNSNRNKSLVLIIPGIALLIIGLVIGMSDNPPGIICVLLGFFLIMFSILSSFGKMKELKLTKKLLFWAPRALCIVTILFMSMFAMDVFGEGRGFWGTSLALLMHLIPSIFMFIILLISWKREWIGGIIFNILALLYIIMFWGRFPIATYFLISGPLAITGILFFLNWKYKAELNE
ncbi:MAG: hypothetical protein NT007_07015 [Candidatus Kapabacteria bacterium]|nr:hypothetical protein [Candidatus Kapabacteria bacterium]